MRALAFVCAAALAGCATALKPIEKSAPLPTPVIAAAPVPRTSPPASLPAVKREEPVSWKFALSNGLQVVVVEDHRRPLVSMRLFLASGAAADIDERAGATYFAMALLGDTFDLRTETGYPVDPLEKSARRQVMDLGGVLRFDVTEDTSWIGIDGFAPDTGEYLKTLSSIVQKPRHSEDSFLGRLDGVGDSLDELEVADPEVLDEHLSHLAFGDSHPYARPVFGTPASISRLGVEEVIERQAALLTPVGGTLLVAGDVRPKEVLGIAERTFGKWRSSAPRADVRIEPPAVRPRASVTFLPRTPSRTTLVCVARPLTDVTAPTGTLAILASVLANSRLSSVLREQHGLTYLATASIVQHRSARALLACSRLSGRDFGQSLRLFVATVEATAKEPPTEQEIESARAGLIAAAETSQDDVPGIVDAWQKAIEWRKPASASAYVAELRKATVDEVRKLAGVVLKPELLQFMFSGEPGVVTSAVKANHLGPVRTPRLDRVEE